MTSYIAEACNLAYYVIIKYFHENNVVKLMLLPVDQIKSSEYLKNKLVALVNPLNVTNWRFRQSDIHKTIAEGQGLQHFREMC